LVTDQERAETKRLLHWLREGSAQKQVEDEDTAGIRRYLLRGQRERRSLDDYTRALLPPTRKATGQEIRAAHDDAAGWRMLGFTLEQVRQWLRAGIEPHDYELVADLVEEGITPDRLDQQFTHPRTAERTTISEVALRFHRADHFGQLGGLCEALDDAGIERVRGQRPSHMLRRRADGA